MKDTILIEKEVPFTTEAIKIYIKETEKRIKFLQPYVSEFDKLKNRLKFAKERLEKRKIS
jgi:hypothetical protein